MSYNKRKIINDPVHGFISIPSELQYDLIQHPYFQRLGRIKQLGLSYMVYPGAQHTRFQHSLGAMYLMQEAIAQLRSKGNDITDEESDAVLSTILLHDVGHAPFSHVLEDAVVDGISHEEISLMMMERINEEMGGRLDMALDIFQNRYHKHFLHQLVSSQLDMDRLDYLIRDSFFTGVVEGSVGTARIIKMLNVDEDHLVVESKGLYSIEKFLIARRMMYWQVYLHKTSVAAEQLMLNILRRAKELALQGTEFFASPSFSYFLCNKMDKSKFISESDALYNYAMLDDTDVLSAVKAWSNHPDKVLSMLSKDLMNRRLFKTEIKENPVSEVEYEQKLSEISEKLGLNRHEASFFLSQDIVSASTYTPYNEDSNIKILYSDRSLKDISEASDLLSISLISNKVRKYFFCYYKE
ncbi:MAG TPA: HD domain-containing protein [Paludibacteraceae bacterium]|nr:HD domain-containing protein [Paludibacteraceae bacterium]HQF50370.1 HD domain-containing protein [Paludibacteraceae bacterium]